MDESPEVFLFKGQKFLYKGLGQIWADWGIPEVFLFKGQMGPKSFFIRVNKGQMPDITV